MSVSPGSLGEGLLVSGRYQVLKKLGTGSMGTVYLARDGDAGRQVALKLIHRERLGSEGLAQLQNEFKAFVSLQHPQIAAAFDFGYTDGGRLPYYTREYVEGLPLAAGPPDFEGQSSPLEFLRPLFDLLDALEYLHSHEILHLDIHAGDLVVAADRTRGSVLIDFGLVRAPRAAGSSSLFALHSALPPELIRGEEALGPAADLYSAGRLLLYRLTGSSEGEPRLPREIPGWGPRLTLELERILTKALQDDPERRFPSSHVFRDALAGAVGGPRAAASLPASLKASLAVSLAEPGELTTGRESEIEGIEEVLRLAAAGRVAVLWFVGPPGIGKTRLLTEARWRAQLGGLPLAEARFFPQPAPESPLLGALRSASMASKRGTPGWLTPLSAEHGGSTLERARRAADAYFAEDDRSLLVLLDDVEHADRESKSILEALLSACASRAARGPTGRGLGIILSSVRPPTSETVLPWRALRRLKPLQKEDARSLLSKLLRPLEAPPELLRKFSREARGLPLRLRRIARALTARWRQAGRIPPDADFPREALRTAGHAASYAGGRRVGDDPVRLKALEALALLARPALRDEVAAAAALTDSQTDRALRGLKDEETLAVEGRGGRRLFHFSDPDAGTAIVKMISEELARRMHRRLVALFRRSRGRSEAGCDLESLARHLLGAGNRTEGRKTALRAAETLRRRGLLQNAARLLTEAAAGEPAPHWRLRFAEEISAFHQAAGDHRDGIEALMPVYKSDGRQLRGAEAVRIRRRLGIHFHRAGQVRMALKLFREVEELADPSRDAEDLAHVDSELAELHTLRGHFQPAEEACRKGLELLAGLGRGHAEFRRGMQVNLHASLGHLYLRRMRLAEAKKELQAALALARGRRGAGDGEPSAGGSGIEALVLNNLGIAHNQLNEHDEARSCFRRAERLLLASGDHSLLIQIACNIATISAKLGEAEEAQESISRAAQLLLRHPGKRLEFFVKVSKALVAHLLGDAIVAAEGFQEALPLGRKLGDSHLSRFCEIYLSEALIAAGRYGEALRRLLRSAAHAGESPIIARMARSRLLCLERLLGRKRAAETHGKEIDRIPRTELALPEAWNDLFVAQAGFLSGADGDRPFQSAMESFRSLGVPAGRRLAQVGLLYSALRREDPRRIRSALKEIENPRTSFHHLLAVIEPLARAEACLALGELDRSKDSLQEAAGATVGLPFLELDGRIEFLHARLADRQGDRESSRHHLHRAIHARDLLVRSLPPGLRKSFLAHPRWQELNKHAERLERPGPQLKTATQGSGAADFHGMVGRSAAMQEVFRTIEQLSDLETAVVIRGETGTGKELVAKAIHQLSSRRRGPFFALHCASLPPQLFESELFGYEAGTFTGADESRPGLLSHLAGGTLLLDEITCLPVTTQAKLLQVLDTRMARPLGGVDARPIDVRFLASTTADLKERVDAQDFRADLYFRLSGAEIRLPPLRARKDDIPDLAKHFLVLHARRLERTPPLLTAEAVDALSGHDWPGNVRELETVVLRVLIGGSPGAPVDRELLNPLLAVPRREDLFRREQLEGRSIDDLRRELDRAYLAVLFRRTGGDLEKMRETLGVKRSNLYAWFRKAGIDVATLRREL